MFSNSLVITVLFVYNVIYECETSEVYQNIIINKQVNNNFDAESWCFSTEMKVGMECGGCWNGLVYY